MDDIEKLIQDLKSEDEDLRYNAAVALGEIADALSRSKVSRQPLDDLKFHRIAVPALVEALQDWDAEVGKKAAEALVKIGKPAVPALIEFIEDEYTVMRQYAAWALVKIGDASAVPALVKALGDENAGMRRSAAEALGKIGYPSAVPALVEALEDEDAEVRRRAAWALGDIVDKCETIEALGGIEDGVKEGFAALRKKHRSMDELIEVKIELAVSLKKVAEKKNMLASKRDMLLKDKPKPPKRGGMYQRMRVRNG